MKLSHILFVCCPFIRMSHLSEEVSPRIFAANDCSVQKPGMMLP